MRCWRRHASATAQFAVRLGIDGVVNRFVGHVQARIVREHALQGSRDLLMRLLIFAQELEHDASRHRIRREFWRGASRLSSGVRDACGHADSTDRLIVYRVPVFDSLSMVHD